MASSIPFLPPELILQIIQSLIPTSPDPVPIALPPTHPITKTLLALTLTSHLTSPLATSYLYTYCIYISNFLRISLLRNTLTATPTLTHHITSLYLSPFQSDRITSLEQIEDLCSFLAPLSKTVKKLVFRIPLKNIQTPFTFERQIHRLVYNTLKAFKQLEVFCSVLDDVHLSIHGQWICTQWPRLRVLGLYNSALEFLEFEVGKLGKGLETLVLGRPDGLGGEVEERFLEEVKDTKTKLNIVVVDVEGEGRRIGNEPLGRGKGMRRVDIDIPEGKREEGYSFLEIVSPLCQGWVEERFLEGSNFEV